MIRFARWALPAAALLFGCDPGMPVPDDVLPVSFDRQIRPILSDRCFQCHGPDENKRKAGLRLDLAGGATAARKGGPAVVPGKPDESLLIHRVSAHDPDDVMPPPDSNRKPVSAEEQALIRRWIAEGAHYEPFWALVPPKPGGSCDIDRLLGTAKLQEIDRSTLLRRLSLDLTGLPPTPEELDAFLADAAPDAVEKQVDRLLASPAYGEHMAAGWMDLARYADTYGYQNDRHRDVWPWRDWLIKAFNDNMPYDRFVTWQIAGDLVPDATRESRLATCFLRLHRMTNEGGSIPEEFRIECCADRVHTFGTAFLGLTFECTRCHDHKYDPLTMRDYYGLVGFFGDIDEFGLYAHFHDQVPTPAMDLPTPEQEKKTAELMRAVAEEPPPAAAPLPAPAFQCDFEKIDPKAKLLGAFEGGSDASMLPKFVDGSLAFDGMNGVAFDGVGAIDRWDPIRISLRLMVEEHKPRMTVLHRCKAGSDAGFLGYDAVLLDGRLQWSMIHFWPGEAISVATRDPLPTKAWHDITLVYDGSSRAAGLKILLDDREAPVTVVRDHLTRTINSGAPFTIGNRFRDQGLVGGRVDDLRVYTFPASPARKALGKHLDSIRRIMVMEDMAAPRDVRLLTRGQYDAPAGDPLPRRPPAALGALPAGAPSNRLGLARWLTAPEHPLTARVQVNRLWAQCFGRGLVPTMENFGSQGDYPTHPELLDALAVDLVRGGWDLKAMLRRIVLSASYRLPNPRRLTAEQVRDQALAASGLLDRAIGGPSVYPSQPEGLWEEKGFGAYPVKDGDQNRRSLYTYWKRTSPPPNMEIFDAVAREVCSARRSETLTPQQTLVLLNDPQFIRCAKALAARATDLAHAFRLVTGRPPDAAELAVLETMLRNQTDLGTADPKAAVCQAILVCDAAMVRR